MKMHENRDKIAWYNVCTLNKIKSSPKTWINLGFYHSQIWLFSRKMWLRKNLPNFENSSAFTRNKYYQQNTYKYYIVIQLSTPLHGRMATIYAIKEKLLPPKLSLFSTNVKISSDITLQCTGYQKYK